VESTNQNEIRFRNGKISGASEVPFKFSVAWTGFMVLATAAPYIINWLQTPPGYRYIWWLTNTQDYYAYMAWAQQAAHGALLFKIKYTALPQPPFLFHPFFLVCGWLSAILHTDLGLTFFAVRAVGVVLFFGSVHRYLSFLQLGRIASIAALILIGVSAGFGEIFALLGVDPETFRDFPADFSLPEFSTYPLMCNPLFPFSLAVMVLTIYWADKGTRSERPSYLWGSGAATGLLALIHPYCVPLLFAWVTTVAVERTRQRALIYLGRYLAAALPASLYVFLLAELLPVVAKHNARGLMPNRPLLGCILGFGIPLLLAVSGFVAQPTRLKRYWQIVAWFLLSLALSYFPFWFQRKLIFGAHVPLCILAGIGCDAIWVRCFNSRLRRAIVTIAAVVLLPLVSATSIHSVLANIKIDPGDLENTPFVRHELMDGVEFLAKNSKPDDLVFADFITSCYIPAYSGNTVFWGHWAMSVDFEQRQEWATNIFDPTSGWDDVRRVREFYGSGLQFIFLDEQLSLRLEEHPETMRLILEKAEKVFENPAVAIYRAKDQRAAR
jgi:hypothetical protein